MGTSVSNLSDLSTNPYLIKLVGQESVHVNNDFWNKLLGFDLRKPLTNESSFYLEAAVCSLQQRFYRNDLRTHNFATLLHHFILNGTQIIGCLKMGQKIKLDDLKMAQNSLLIFRLFTKFILENRSNHSIQLHFGDIKNEATNNVSLAEYTVHLLFTLIIELEPIDLYYELLYEAVSSLLILLSAQVSGNCNETIPTTCAYLMSEKCLTDSERLIHRLILNIDDNMPCPPHISANAIRPGMLWSAASFLASGFLSVLTLGYANKAKKPEPNIGSRNAQTRASLNPLANQCCLLLLVLTTQSTGSVQFTELANRNLSLSIFRSRDNNPYRNSLFSLVSEGSASSTPLSNPSSTKQQFINFDSICDTLASTIESDASVLLLYLLLHRNDKFRTHVMETKAYQKFTIPICTLLYQSPETNSHLVYMALIVILMLTENEGFSKDVHDLPVKNLPSTMDRQFNNINLGSMLVLVLTRTIQHHLCQLKDKYLHINSLAALANMSPKISKLHPNVSQALVCLLQKLVKRHKRLITEIHSLNDKIKEENKMKALPTLVDSLKEPVVDVKLNMLPPTESLLQDLSLLEEVIRMTLEIFNSILSHSLSSNNHLIYCLLYHREYITPLLSHPAFQDVMQNIDTVLNFFASQIEKELGKHPTETSSVMNVINNCIGNFSRCHTLKDFQELKFKYVEEESPDDFFIPYIWSLVYKSSGLALNEKSLQFFGGFNCLNEINNTAPT